MHGTQSMRRRWGLGLIVMGAALLVSVRVGDNTAVNIAVGVVVILIGQWLPLPPAFEARILALPLLTRAVLVFGGILIAGLLLVALSELTDPAVLPLGILAAGIVLLIASRRA